MPLQTGQGYSTPSGYRLPSGETISPTEENRRAIIRTGRSGGGRTRREIEAEVQAERNRQEQIKKQEAENTLREAIERGRIKEKSQTIGGQLQSKKQVTNLNQGKIQFAKGTAQDNIPKRDITIYTQPTYIERQTGAFRDTKTGKDIPITEVVYFDPIGESLGGGAYVSTERKATQEEVKEFREQTNVLQASTDKRTKVDIAKSKGRSLAQRYNQINYDLSQSLESYGVTDKRIEKVSDILAFSTPLGLKKKTREFTSGLISGTIKDIKNKPLSGVVTLGVGVGGGVTKNILVTGSSKIKPIYGGIVRGGLAIGEVGVGTIYAGTIAVKSLSADSARGAGEIISVGTKDALLFGYGYGKGYKATEQIKGFIATRGRSEIPFEKLTTKEVISGEDKFLLIPKEKQLKAFKERRFSKEIGEPQGGFHTTPQRFKQDIIDPQEGTSELPGLYISPGISPYFAKLSGSESRLTLPTFKDIFYPSSKPGVAFIKPKGFREVKYNRVSPYVIGEQPFKFRFTSKPKEGFADLPLMKNEAEAILRPQTGSYIYESGKYYTKIEGVRVPIDVFKYDRPNRGKNLLNERPSKIKTLESSGSYELPRRQSYKPRSRLSSRISSLDDYGYSSLSRVSQKSILNSGNTSSVIKYKYSSSSPYKRSKTYKSQLSKTLSSSYPGHSRSSISSNMTFKKPKKIKLKGDSIRKSQLLRQPTKYQASLTSSLLNIRSKRKPLFAGGLSIRPIIS